MTAPLADAERWGAWDRFVEAQPEAGFMQSSAWARVRAGVGYEHFAVTLKDGDSVVGGALVGKWTYAPGRCFYYIQDGPLLPADPGFAAEVWEAVMQSVERHRRADTARVSHLRIEPRWPALPAFVQGFAPPLAADGYTEPRHTLCIDLRASDDELLAQMKPKGRYNVRVARQHGVAVVEDHSARGVADFLRIQRRTADRHAIDAKPPSYFRTMLAEFEAPRRVRLFFAEYRGRRLATALVVTFGRRATYFYGGSLVLHRHVMAPYLLHFEIMRAMQQAGCDAYDLWGVAPPDQPDHAWRDISTFKRKFGGAEVALVPTLDRVFDAAAYRRDHGAARAETRVAPLPGLPGAARAPRAREAVAKRLRPVDLPERQPMNANPAESVHDVRCFKPGAPRSRLDALTRAFPASHFERLFGEGFPFYRTTFWYPLDRPPENVFEQISRSLQPLAEPSARVVGVEWWFSVLQTNATPQWLLPCHFDRSDLGETDFEKIRHPERASVLFLSAVPYGELVVTDQVQTEHGARPKQPTEMRFIRPQRNLYAVFPGHLYHGVIGRLWRPAQDTTLRVTMAINWWTERPTAPYLRDSRDCLTAFGLAPQGGAAGRAAKVSPPAPRAGA